MFIAVEGIDGSGKSTTIKELKKFLEKKGHTVVQTAEPTNLSIGRLIRDELKNSENNTPLLHEKLALMFAADRLDHLQKRIWPALKEKKTVLTDRYFFSSVAYQSTNVSYEWVKGVNRFATLPNILVFIDVKIDKALERIKKFRDDTELYETKDFLTDIDNNYRRIIKDFEDRLKVVFLDGSLGMDEIYDDIEKKFEGVL
jgi:dTMP kinase